MPPARCQAGHACRLGVEDRGTGADHRRAEQQRGIAARMRKHDQPQQGAAHAGHQRKRLRPPVRVHADHRLQQRSRQLKGQRDQSDLREVEAVGVLDERIDGRQQRLHHVVEQMREAERHHDRERAGLGKGWREFGRRRFLHVLFPLFLCERRSSRLAPEGTTPDAAPNHFARLRLCVRGAHCRKPAGIPRMNLSQATCGRRKSHLPDSAVTSGSRVSTAVPSSSLLPCATSMRNRVSAWADIGMARCCALAAVLSISRSLSTWRA